MNLQAAWQQAQGREHAGRVAQAQAIYREVLAAAPHSGLLHLVHRQVLRFLGEAEAARAALERAMRCDPGRDPAECL